MRKLACWLLLAGLLGGMPVRAWGQNYNYPVPPVPFTGPLSHPRYETGGFYIGFETLLMRQTRPIDSQPIAFRGFVDIDGSIAGLGQGAFIGSGALALSTQQLRGPGTFQPGMGLTLGWLFESEVCFQFEWWHLADSRYSATASLLPAGLNGGAGLADTFLTAGVYNFPFDYGGNPQNVNAGNVGATFGIWNAASLMTIDYIQRFDKVDFSARIPVSMTDSHRFYGLVGPRAVTMFERFTWRTVDYDLAGIASPLTTAIYSNTTSNRYYGVHAGCGHDWFLGDTPAGAFAITFEAEAALYLDFVKGRAKYQIGDGSTAASRARNFWSLVPGVEANVKLWWYPWEAVQVSVGYDMLSFFNTYSSPNPVDFNFGAIDPEWRDGTFRLLHGLNLGISFVF